MRDLWGLPDREGDGLEGTQGQTHLGQGRVYVGQPRKPEEFFNDHPVSLIFGGIRQLLLIRERWGACVAQA